jgi:hypothetical protein
MCVRAGYSVPFRLVHASRDTLAPCRLASAFLRRHSRHALDRVVIPPTMHHAYHRPGFARQSLGPGRNGLSVARVLCSAVSPPLAVLAAHCNVMQEGIKTNHRGHGVSSQADP